MAAITGLKPRSPRSQPWVQAGGFPTEAFASFIESADALLKMLNGEGGIILIDAANDAAAAAAGVNVGALYRNGSVMMIRVV